MERKLSWFWLALGATLPLGGGLGILGWGLAHSTAPEGGSTRSVVAVTASTPVSPRPTVSTETTTKTVTVTLTVTKTAAPPKLTTPSPSPTPARLPQGELVVDGWQNGAADLKCVDVQTSYDNRSDTAVDSVTQTFITHYTPKHKGGYPDLVDGPAKILTQTVGIAPYSKKTITWHVCAPELASKQNPPPPDMPGYFMSEIGATPTLCNWRWVSR